MKRVFFSLFALMLLGLLMSAAAIILSDDVRWRAKVLASKAGGDFDDISWAELLPKLMPGSGYWLQPVTEGQSLYETIKNRHTNTKDVETGASIYRSQCSVCHEALAGTGAPNLKETQFKHGASDWALFQIIRDGISDTGMAPAGLDEQSIWQVIAYLRFLRSKNKEASNESEASLELQPPRYEELLRGTASHLWPTYSGSYDGQRYSPLDEINAANVDRLGIDWVLQLPTDEPYSESTPVVIKGAMYLTVSPNMDMAVDPGSGRILWSEARPFTSSITVCCGPHNRGVAILDDKVFRGTLDGFLIARDARTGEQLWEVEVGPARSGHSITAAPLAVENMVITGIAGGEYGIRGYLDAYDAATGERAWRLYTIPAEGEPGNDSWEGNSWRTGGGPTWMTGSYDPDLRLVYWGVGNPAPDFNGDDREGDNLYTNSLIAVELDTGKLRWYFQFTPHDLHDWDANQVPVLVDAPVNGVMRKLVLTANKNGFAYTLDRVTGEFLLAHEVVDQTWAESIDDNGRPVKRPGIAPTDRGTVTRPGTAGGANWWPPSYNRHTNLVHYSLLDSGNVFFKSEEAYTEGERYVGSWFQPVTGEPHTPYVKAFRAGTGELAWAYQLPPRRDWPKVGGSLTTAGKIVVFGDRDYLFVLNAESGEELWRANLGSSIHAAPVTYKHDGQQRIAVAAGRSLYSFSLRTPAGIRQSEDAASRSHNSE